MVIRHFCHFGILVAFVGAIGNLPISLPNSRYILRSRHRCKDRPVQEPRRRPQSRAGSRRRANPFRTDIARKDHAREISLFPLLRKSASLFICHWFSVVGHTTNYHRMILRSPNQTKMTILVPMCAISLFSQQYTPFNPRDRYIRVGQSKAMLLTWQCLRPP